MPRGSKARAPGQRQTPEQDQLAALRDMARLLRILVSVTLQGLKESHGQPELISMQARLGVVSRRSPSYSAFRPTR